MSERCDHSWSEDYVCTTCGAVRLSYIPMWAMLAPWPSNGRGARSVWLALFSFADRITVPGPVEIEASIEAICRRTGGLHQRTVQGYLSWLERAGWIRRLSGPGDSCFELAWVVPFPDELRTVDEPGYVYVVSFSNGVVKVGRSGSPRERIASHRHSAQCFGLSLEREWISEKLSMSMAAEQRVIAAAASIGRRTCGSEWFVDIRFSDAVRIAESVCQESSR